MTEPLLQVRDIAKSFGGVPALRGIDVAVRASEIHALLGQNGAGKSTLIKILNGVHPAGSFTGEIILAGQPVSFASPADAAAAGIVYVPQEIEVLEQLSVAENVFAGRTGLGDGFLVNRREMEARTRAIFADLGLPMDARAIVASLTSAQRHLVMVARALSNRPRVLMLDEPTASLSGTEVDGALRRAAPAPRPGRHHALHHPPPARGAGDLRPRHRAPRRPGRRRDRSARVRRGAVHLLDVRPAPEPPLPRPPRRPTRAPGSKS